MRKLGTVRETVSVLCPNIDLIVEIAIVRNQTHTFSFTSLRDAKENDKYEVLSPESLEPQAKYLVNAVIDDIRAALIHEYRSRVMLLPFDSDYTKTTILKEFIDWRRSDIMSLIASRVAEEYQLKLSQTARCSEVRVYALNKDKFAYYDVSVRPEEKNE